MLKHETDTVFLLSLFLKNNAIKFISPNLCFIKLFAMLLKVSNPTKMYIPL